MHDPEEIERVRQAIMRYRELLDLLHADVAAAEKRYAALLAAVPQEQRDTLQEKLLQREAAIIALGDMDPMRRAVQRVTFDLRGLHREFEEISGHIAPRDDDEDAI